MRRASLLTALGALGCLLGCPGPSGSDGGTGGSAGTTGGSGPCGAACLPPDAGECLPAAERCSLFTGGTCCPGLYCIDAGCALPLNRCPNGEQLLPSGCGCDPSLGPDAGCASGFVCSSGLQCVLDAGQPIVLVAQPVGAPCDPTQPLPCAQPEAAADGGPDAGDDAGADPDGGGTVDCVPDPSGVYLYVCAQACATDRDCPLAWQSCNSPFAPSGHCGDNPCTAVPAESAKEFFSPCPDGGGLCLPFSELIADDGGTQSYGLCLQASDAGPNSVCGDPPSRDGPLCDLQQLCVLGRCRSTCNAAEDALLDAGTCLPSEVCWPLGVQPVVPGAAYAAGGCVDMCEVVDGGRCDAGVPMADGGPDAGPDGGKTDAGLSPPDGGELGDGGDAG